MHKTSVKICPIALSPDARRESYMHGLIKGDENVPDGQSKKLA